MPLTPKPRTRRTPRNKSARALEAEARGERTWTNWLLRDLVDQVVRCNRRGVSARDLRAVGNLDLLKARLLHQTETHHTGLRMPDPLRLTQVQYFGINWSRAEKLTADQLQDWREHPPSADELADEIANLTGRRYAPSAHRRRS